MHRERDFSFNNIYKWKREREKKKLPAMTSSRMSVCRNEIFSQIQMFSRIYFFRSFWICQFYFFQVSWRDKKATQYLKVFSFFGSYFAVLFRFYFQFALSHRCWFFSFFLLFDTNHETEMSINHFFAAWFR